MSFTKLKNVSWISAAMVLAAVNVASAAENALCASSEQAAKVIDAYKAAPGGFPFMVSKQLTLTESQVVSALPSDQAIGVGNSEFAKIWETLTKWDHGVVLVLTGGQVLEIHGPIKSGAPSTRSKNFNLSTEGDGMSGHLRPDLLSGIYAISLPAKDDNRIRGIMFMDGEGKSAFSIFMPTEGTPLTPAQIAQFDATWNAMKGLPTPCEKK